MQNFQNLFGFQAAPGMAPPQHQPQQQLQQQQPQQPQQNRPRKEVAVVPIMNPNASAKDLYCVEGAVMKEYDPIKKEWTSSTIKVQIERKPFAEGGMRCAYRMKIVEGMEVHGKDRIFVLKLSKDPKEVMRQYYKDVETQMEARKWALEFNKSGAPKQVHFIEAMVIILTDRPTKPTCTMEKYVEGDYVKYNDNWAWCDDKRNTPQAFSHWSWEASGNKVLICDLQGVGDCWTDPQIHTMDGRGFGKGNAGLQGIRQFLQRHKCNAICRALRLQSLTGRVKAQDEGTKWGAQLQQQHGGAHQRKRAHPGEHEAAGARGGAGGAGARAEHAEEQRQGEAAAAAAAAAGPQGVGLTIDGGMAQGILLPLIVVSIKPHSPAALSGLVKRGDFVIQVDDCPVQGAAVGDVKKLIRGPAGSKVTIYLQRGVKTVTVELVRGGAAGTHHKRPCRRTQEPSQVVRGDGDKTAHQVFQEVFNGKGNDTDVDTIPFQQQQQQQQQQQAQESAPPKQGKAKMLPHPPGPHHDAAHEDVQAQLRRRQQREEVLRKLERFPQNSAAGAGGGAGGGGGEGRGDKENVRNGAGVPGVPDFLGMIAKNMQGALPPHHHNLHPDQPAPPPFFL